MSKFYRIKLDKFGQFFDEKVKEKYEPQGLRGLRSRFQAMMNTFMDACKLTIEIHQQLEQKIIMIEKFNLLTKEKRLDTKHIEVQK
jgi:hypothetical protein